MSRDEPTLPQPRERIDDNPGPLPFWRIHPAPERLARMVWTARQRPDWSPEALKDLVKILRMRIEPEADLEAAIRHLKALAEMPFNEETERFFRGEIEVLEHFFEIREQWTPDWPERGEDELLARARRELQAQKEGAAERASKSGSA